VPLHLVTVVFAAVAVAGLLVSWRSLGQSRAAPVGEAGTPVRRAHFMAVSGLLLNAIFLLTILAEGMAPLFVDPCLIPTLDPPRGFRLVEPVLALGLGPAPAFAAHGGLETTGALAGGWGLTAASGAVLILAGGLYARGAREVWRRAGAGMVVGRWQATAYGAALVALAIALVSPLDTLSAALFSAHMVQHLLLVLVAAPLLVIAEPLVPLLWALPRRWRRALGRSWRRHHWVAGAWRIATTPLLAMGVHAVAVGFWHVPAPYEAALTDTALHVAEHASFLVTALLFWWALIHAGRAGGAGHGTAVIAVFVASLLMTALGALITLAPAAWYPAHAAGAAAWGLTPLQDQQLAGLIMWVPAGLVYVGAAAALFLAWLGEAERRVTRREAAQERTSMTSIATMKRSSRALGLSLVLLATPAVASAEWFVDAYAGWSMTERADVDVGGISVAGVPVRASLLDVEPEDSPLFGVRAGYWFGFLPEVGLGVDVFYFRPDVRRQRVTATGTVSGRILDEPLSVTVAGPVTIASADLPAVVVGGDLLLRWRFLQTPDIPNGRLQPYITLGPALLVTDSDDLGTTLGFKVAGGFAWQFHRRLAVFGEYRFTRFTPSDVESGGLRYSADVNTHHVLGGISLRF
jgi:cytochrome c oxidase assembly factor CtaG/opacity protein-like surface antigen